MGAFSVPWIHRIRFGALTMPSYIRTKERAWLSAIYVPSHLVTWPIYPLVASAPDLHLSSHTTYSQFMGSTGWHLSLTNQSSTSTGGSDGLKSGHMTYTSQIIYQGKYQDISWVRWDKHKYSFLLDSTLERDWPPSCNHKERAKGRMLPTWQRAEQKRE